VQIVDAIKLLENLCREPREAEWLEFKVSWFREDDIGAYVSGLANSAILHQKEHAYLVFGVEDEAHKQVGTNIRVKNQKIGNEPFENWLSHLLQPKLTINIVEFDKDGKHFAIVVINPAYIMPVRFKNVAFIRVDTVLKNLRDYPERERSIWSITSKFSFEHGIAAGNLKTNDILELFHCQKLLDALEINKKSDTSIINHFIMEGFLIDDKQGGYDATNLFAIVAGKNLSNFPSISKKAPRVVTYRGTDKLDSVGDQLGRHGYGVSFNDMLKYISDRIPHKEEMRLGNRITVYDIPIIAIRELVANALIHQDFMSVGDGPLIEIFKDRIRIINPGSPLISTDRFIDAPPKSRNERLAGLMKRLGFCEERGSGVDRALDAIEEANLRAPLFQEIENTTVVTLYRGDQFANMSKEERIRACYQHAALCVERGRDMSNATLRKRFGLTDKQYPQASIVIRDTMDSGLIRPLDEDQGNRNARYVPFWA
jgi:ATP-dependent DNA helicase RecG